MARRLLVGLGMCAALAACGGGDGGAAYAGPVPTAVTVAGKAIDGYVSGATVYLDVDFDGTQDAWEPAAVTGTAGDYRLEIPASYAACAGYVPIVVDVPVGAVDADLGPVTEPYQMVLPPRFAPIDDAAFHNVTPLTTALWGEISRALGDAPTTLSCQAVSTDARTRQRVLDVLQQSVRRMVAHYNIADRALFEDYLATGDARATALAREIVRGLQRSLADTVELRAQNPGALGYVDYHIGDDRDAGGAYPEAWYRETWLAAVDRSSFELAKVDGASFAPVRTIIYGESTKVRSGAFEHRSDYEYESRRGDGSPYTCDIKETIASTQRDREYELVNLSSRSADVFSDCVVERLAGSVTHRYAFVSYADAAARYSSQFVFYPEGGTFPFLDGWVDLRDRLDTLDVTELTTALGALPYHFDEDGSGGARMWFKSKTVETAAGGSVVIRKGSDGRWERITTRSDGTYTRECGIDGVTWTAC